MAHQLSLLELAPGLDIKVRTILVRADQLRPIIHCKTQARVAFDKPALIPNANLLVSKTGEGFEILNYDAARAAAWMNPSHPERLIQVHDCSEESVADIKLLCSRLDPAIYYQE